MNFIFDVFRFPSLLQNNSLTYSRIRTKKNKTKENIAKSYVAVVKCENFYRFHFSARTAEYRELLEQNDGTLDDNDDQRSIQMQNQQRQRRQRQENTLEAQIQPGDTLQAIALRYNCTVSVFISEKKNTYTPSINNISYI